MPFALTFTRSRRSRCGLRLTLLAILPALDLLASGYFGLGIAAGQSFVTVCDCKWAECKGAQELKTTITKHTVRRRETLTGILYQLGVGSRSANFCLYTPKRHNWVELVKSLNPQVTDWKKLSPGTTLLIPLPQKQLPAEVAAPVVVKDTGSSFIRGARSIRSDSILLDKAYVFEASLSYGVGRRLMSGKGRFKLGLDLGVVPFTVDSIYDERFYWGHEELKPVLAFQLGDMNARFIQVGAGPLAYRNRFRFPVFGSQLGVLTGTSRAIKYGAQAQVQAGLSFRSWQVRIGLEAAKSADGNLYRKDVSLDFRHVDGVRIFRRHFVPFLYSQVNHFSMTGVVDDSVLALDSESLSTVSFYLPVVGLGAGFLW